MIDLYEYSAVGENDVVFDFVVKCPHCRANNVITGKDIHSHKVDCTNCKKDFYLGGIVEDKDVVLLNWRKR